MTLKELSILFNRAIFRSFEIWNFLFLFSILFLCGVVFIFFQGISNYLEGWWQTALSSISIFIVLGILLAAEIVLLCRYSDFKENSIRKTLYSAWESMLKASYLALPLFLAFLLFWIVLGLFLALQSIPYFGTILGVTLAFIPFLLNVASILLLVAALFLLFFVSPSIAHRREIDYKSIQRRFQVDLFTNLLFLTLAFFPLWIVYKILATARGATLMLFSVNERTLEYLVQSFMIMIPFAALITPAVNFFFNFAMEAELAFYPTPGDKSSLGR